MPDIDLKKTIAVHLRLDDVVDRMFLRPQRLRKLENGIR